MSKYNTGLILSGGGARGFAHLGAIKALEEHQIIPGIVSGVSAGAIVGAFYADGYSPEEILEMFVEKRIFSLIRFSVPRNGFLKMPGIRELIQHYLRAKTFKELSKPLVITVSNLNLGKVEYLTSGKLQDAIIASSSIPVLFEPHRIGEYDYIDGGVFDVLPVKPIQEQCHKLIGININPHYDYKKISGIIRVAEWSFYLRILASVDESLSDCDMAIEPRKLDGYGIFDVGKAREMFDIGYEETIKVLENQPVLTSTLVASGK
ncbi:MAG: patatin-like phospholipase family protein [Chlorobi bacterium]|nr:patatin-like phospholipase family protein [Chlorobiota bacterium]